MLRYFFRLEQSDFLLPFSPATFYMINTHWALDLQLICSICVLFDLFFFLFSSLFASSVSRSFSLDFIEGFFQLNGFDWAMDKMCGGQLLCEMYSVIETADGHTIASVAAIAHPQQYLLLLLSYTLFISAWIISSMLKLFTYHSVGSHSGKSQLAISNDARTQQRQTLNQGIADPLYWHLLSLPPSLSLLLLLLSLSLLSLCLHFWSVFLLFSMVYWFANKLHRIAFLMRSDLFVDACKHTHTHTHSQKWTQTFPLIFTTSNYIVAAIFIWPFCQICPSAIYPAIWWICHNWIPLGENVFYGFSPHWGG